jgi:hypothetical protein
MMMATVMVPVTMVVIEMMVMTLVKLSTQRWGSVIGSYMIHGSRRGRTQQLLQQQRQQQQHSSSSSSSKSIVIIISSSGRVSPHGGNHQGGSS